MHNGFGQGAPPEAQIRGVFPNCYGDNVVEIVWRLLCRSALLHGSISLHTYQVSITSDHIHPFGNSEMGLGHPPVRLYALRARCRAGGRCNKVKSLQLYRCTRVQRRTRRKGLQHTGIKVFHPDADPCLAGKGLHVHCTQ